MGLFLCLYGSLQVVCGVGRSDKPLKHQATVPQTLESSLRQWGLKDEAQVAAIHAQIKEKAEAAMKAFMDMEASLSAEQRGGRRAQTDIIGELPSSSLQQLFVRHHEEKKININFFIYCTSKHWKINEYNKLIPKKKRFGCF